MSLKEDANWPRAAAWLKPADGVPADIALFGVPANTTSISPTGADKTPAAIREALLRYSLQSSTGDLDSLIALLQRSKAREEPKPPAGYTAEELERDNPFNAWMHS